MFMKKFRATGIIAWYRLINFNLTYASHALGSHAMNKAKGKVINRASGILKLAMAL